MGSFIINCQCNKTHLQGTIKKLLHKIGCKNNFGLNDKCQSVEGWAEMHFGEGKPIPHGAYKAFHNLQQILVAAWFRDHKNRSHRKWHHWCLRACIFTTRTHIFNIIISCRTEIRHWESRVSILYAVNIAGEDPNEGMSGENFFGQRPGVLDQAKSGTHIQTHVRVHSHSIGQRKSHGQALL